jgi:hypothetical protein
MELRCANKKFGELIIPGAGLLEVFCDSRFCGKRPGVTVRHRFDLQTGEMVEDKQFKTPTKEQ